MCVPAERLKKHIQNLHLEFSWPGCEPTSPQTFWVVLGGRRKSEHGKEPGLTVGKVNANIPLMKFWDTFISTITKKQQTGSSKYVCKGYFKTSTESQCKAFNFRDGNISYSQPMHFLGCCFWLRLLLQQEIKITLLRQEATELRLAQVLITPRQGVWSLSGGFTEDLALMIPSSEHPVV